jgi:glycosyltransferase involved in cell wall biosynthesis
MRVCFVSTAMAPTDAGGIAQMVTSSAEALARAGVETSIAHVDRSGSGAAARSGPDRVDRRVRIASVEPVADWAAAGFTCSEHADAAAALAAVRELHADASADLIVAPESHAPAYVLLAARRSGEELLRATRIALRICGGVQIVHRHDLVPVWRPETVAAWTMERAQFALADAVIVPGREMLGVVRHIYGEAIPPVTEIAELARGLPVADPVPRAAGGPLRLLYLGRLELMKGTLDLAEALWAIGGDRWTLTLAGADTQTAPLGGSIAAEIERLFAADGRVRAIGEIAHAQVPALLAQHDMLVVPSTWETWSTALTECVGAGLPALVTPVGCLADRVARLDAGWVAPGIGPAALAAALRPLIADPGVVDRKQALLRARPADTDRTAFVDAHIHVARTPARLTHGPPCETPLSALVLADEDTEPLAVARSLDSLLLQHRPLARTLVVGADMSAATEAVATERGALCLDIPLAGRARACGAGAERTTGHLLILPAGMTIAAGFATRAGAVLDADADVAWVSCWIAGTPPIRMLGADPQHHSERNLLGCLPALMRRSIAESHGFDPRHEPLFDWHLLRRLARDGHPGLVIPEELAISHAPDPLDRLPGHLRAVAIAQMDIAVAAESIPWSPATRLPTPGRLRRWRERRSASDRRSPERGGGEERLPTRSWGALAARRWLRQTDRHERSADGALSAPSLRRSRFRSRKR